jgi:hypothetical protein
METNNHNQLLYVRLKKLYNFYESSSKDNNNLRQQDYLDGLDEIHNCLTNFCTDEQLNTFYDCTKNNKDKDNVDNFDLLVSSEHQKRTENIKKDGFVKQLKLVK